jgi:hypothetical protein
MLIRGSIRPILAVSGRSEAARLESQIVTDEAPPDRQPPDAQPADTPAPATSGVLYKGEPLEATRGPGLGCFWVQVAILAVFVVLTPLSAAWEWPTAVSAGLLIAMLVLLLLTGQTVIFLLRLVAADRRASGRRRPLASKTLTVGEIEDETTADGTPRDGEPGVRE